MTPQTQQSLFRVVGACALHSQRFRLSDVDDLALPPFLREALGEELVDFFEKRFPEYLKQAPRKNGFSGSSGVPGGRVRTSRGAASEVR